MNSVDNRFFVALLILTTLFVGSAVSFGASDSGTIKIGTLDKGTGFDPADVFEMLSWEINDNIYDGLVTLNPKTGEVEPQLAKSWTISDDRKKITFELREGVKFHDGSRFTAEAVKFSLIRAANLGGSPGFLVADFVDTENIELVNQYKIEIPLKVPYADALNIFSIPIYSPVNPKKYSMDEFKPKNPSGTGPYKLTSWVKGSKIVLEKFEDYWGEEPKNDKIIWKLYSKGSNLKFALQNKEVDMAWRSLSLEDVEQLLERGNYETSEGVGQIRFLVFNTQSKPFDNVNLRKGIAAAINRSSLVNKVYYGLVPELYSLLPANLSSSVPSFKNVYGEGSLDMAKDYLKEAGYTEDSPLEMELWYTPSHYGALEDELALVLKSQLERTGAIEVTLKSQEWATYIGRVAEGEMQYPFLLGWGSAVFIPDWYTTNFLSKGGAKSMGSLYENEEMYDMVKEQRQTLDSEKRAEILADIQQLTAEDAPYAPLVQRISRVVQWDYIDGVDLGPGFTFRLSDIMKK
ncbi:peptide ABC transporter substrate-binding protein [Candidatus Bipolaricaulota bacterium]|nr:peptide ABC transporter substrate-binding protein [Candidatus Bipolaricaulota bacterium]